MYIGTTGGGVWVSQNAATSNADQVQFTPLTDKLSALAGARDASISIGALTVQPGGTGVILREPAIPMMLSTLTTERGFCARQMDGLVEPDSSDVRSDIRVYRRGICGFCVEHSESAIGGGRICKPTEDAGQCGAPNQAMQGCTTPWIVA